MSALLLRFFGDIDGTPRGLIVIFTFLVAFASDLVYDWYDGAMFSLEGGRILLSAVLVGLAALKLIHLDSFLSKLFLAWKETQSPSYVGPGAGQHLDADKQAASSSEIDYRTSYLVPNEAKITKLVSWAIALVVAALLVRLVPMPDGSSTRPYRIGYQKTSLYQHLFAAAEQGAFDAFPTRFGRGVELVSFTSANNMLTALMAGEIEVTGLTNLEVLLKANLADSTRFNLVNALVWTQDAYPDYILWCGTDQARDSTLAAYIGTPWGRHRGSAVGAFFSAVLDSLGVTEPASIEQLSPAQMLAAVRSNRVELLYAMDPAATELMVHAGCEPVIENPIRFVTDLPVPISGSLISDKLIREEPEVALAMEKALSRGIAITRDPQMRSGVRAAIQKYTGADSTVVSLLNPSEYWTSAEIGWGQLQKVADDFWRKGVIPSRTSVESLGAWARLAAAR